MLQAFQLKTIPMVKIVDSEGNVIDESARAKIEVILFYLFFFKTDIFFRKLCMEILVQKIQLKNGKNY